MPEPPSLDGYDTALARLLHASERVSLPELQRALDHVRLGHAAELGACLVDRGLLDACELDEIWRPCLPQPQLMSATKASVSGPSNAPLGPPLEAPAQRLGPYVILEELGRGGMGLVLKAFDPQLKRPVAIKQILGQVGPEELLRFRREAELAARIDHPGVATIYEVVTEGEGAPYLVMDLIQGRTLKALCEEGLKNRQAASLVKGVAEAVAAAHAAGIIHRDLKPQNVVVTPDERPVVLDFGLARRVEDESVQLTVTGDVVGTPAYMAPEQALGLGEVGPAADVYGLGALLYECLTGSAPFGGPTLMAVLDKVTNEEPTRPSSSNPDVHSDLETICLKCLEKAPAARYTSAQALADDLGRFLEGEPVLARPVGPVSRLWRRLRKRSGWLVLAAALCLAAPLTYLGYGLSQDQKVVTRQREAQRFLNAGSKHLAQGELEEARAALDSALELRPDSAQALTLRGEARRQAGQLKEARADFEEALRLDPEALEAWLGLGRTEDAAAKPEKALVAFSEALRIDPDHAPALAARGDAYARAGLGKESERDFERLIELRPSDYEAHLQRARSRVDLGDPAGAVRHYKQAFQLGARGELPALQFTRMQVKAGLLTPEQARSVYERYANLKPEKPRQHYVRGLARLLLADYRGARDDLALALAATSDREVRKQILCDLATAKQGCDDPNGALSDLTQALELDPSWGPAYNARGSILHRRGDLEAARADFTQAIMLRPSWVSPRANRAALDHALGNLRQALDDVSDAIELDPESSHGKFHLDWALIRDALKDPQGANEDYTTALSRSLSPFDKARAHAHRGTARAALGQTREAALDYEESLRLIPNQTKAPERRAQIQRWLGRPSRY